MELQFVKDGVPYSLELKSTVQIHGETWLPNEDGFCNPPHPVVGITCFIQALLHMCSNTIPVLTSSLSRQVFRFLFVSPMYTWSQHLQGIW